MLVFEGTLDIRASHSYQTYIVYFVIIPSHWIDRLIYRSSCTGLGLIKKKVLLIHNGMMCIHIPHMAGFPFFFFFFFLGGGGGGTGEGQIALPYSSGHRKHLYVRKMCAVWQIMRKIHTSS